MTQWVLDPNKSDVKPGTKNPLVTRLIPKGDEGAFTQNGSLVTGDAVSDVSWHLEITALSSKFARLGAIVVQSGPASGTAANASFSCQVTIKGTQVPAQAAGAFTQSGDATRMVFDGKVTIPRDSVSQLASSLLRQGHPLRAAAGAVGSLVLDLHSEYVAS